MTCFTSVPDAPIRIYRIYPYYPCISSWFTHNPNTWTLGTVQCVFSVSPSAHFDLQPLIFMIFPTATHQRPEHPWTKLKASSKIFQDLPTFMPPLIMMTPSSWHVGIASELLGKSGKLTQADQMRSARLKLLDLLLRQLQLLRGLTSKTPLTPVANLVLRLEVWVNYFKLQSLTQGHNSRNRSSSQIKPLLRDVFHLPNKKYQVWMSQVKLLSDLYWVMNDGGFNDISCFSMV